MANPAKTSLLENEHISINLSVVHDASGNDEQYCQLMIQTFLDTFPQTLQKLEQAIEQKNPQLVYQTAHYAKSSLSIIQIGEMRQQAYAIETIGKAGMQQATDAKALLAKLKEQYLQAAQLLVQTFPGVSTTNQ